MKKQIILSLLALFVASGCAWFETQKEQSAGELVTEGMSAFERGKYRKAIEAFTRLRDWYPFSKFAGLAELKTADAYYRLEEYDEAVLTYEEFENLHPKNEAIPYVIFQIGRCYFEQIDTIDRDQSAARKALETFQRLRREFPDNLYARKADPLIEACYQSLAGHEFYVGMFYFKNEHYQPALTRFESVLTNYPDVGGLHRKARRYISRSQALLKEQEAKN